MKQYLIIGAVVAVIAALVLATMGGVIDNPLTPEDETKDDRIGNDDCSCTIFIYDPTTEQVLSATLNMDSLSFGEMAMLAFGAGVREVAFTPVVNSLDYTATVAKLYRDQNYQIWSDVKVTVTGSGMKSLDKLTGTFTGTGGSTQRDSAAPNHGTSNIAMTNTAGTASIVATKTSGLSFGTSVTVSQNTDNSGSADAKRFTKVSGTNLLGDYVDGAKISVTVYAYGTTANGVSTYHYTSATMLIKVTAWSSSYLTASITSMSAGGV